MLPFIEQSFVHTNIAIGNEGSALSIVNPIAFGYRGADPSEEDCIMNKLLNQKKEEKPRTNKWGFAVYIGFFAGLIWGGIKIIENYFHLTSLSPGFLIEPFFLHNYLMTVQGYFIGWFAFIVMSIVASLLYAVFLAKAKGPWVGIIYGLVWWGVIFLLIGPVSGMTNWISFMEFNTIITDLCLFIVWGLFIGYSISFEFTDERVREPFEKSAEERQFT